MVYKIIEIHPECYPCMKENVYHQINYKKCGLAIDDNELALNIQNSKALYVCSRCGSEFSRNELYLDREWIPDG